MNRLLLVATVVALELLICILPVIADAQGQPTLVSVAFNPATVIGGTSSTATITISAPAKQNGLDITLSFNATVAHVTSSTINIPEGQSSKTVTVDTDLVATQQVVILTANTRADTKSGAITVLPLLVSSIAIAPASVISGEQATVTITLTGNAPSNGFPVSLSSNNAAIRVPASVSVMSNQRTANVTMTAATVSAPTSVTITAGEGASSKTAATTVLPVPVTIATFQFPTELVSGGGVVRQITLSGPAPEGGKIIQISTSGADILRSAGAPVADTIAAGSKTKMKINTAPVTDTDRPFEITATLDGISTRRSGTLRATTITSVSVPDSLVAGTLGTLKVTLRGVPPGGSFPVVIKSENESAIPSLGGVSATINAGTMSFPIYGNSVSSRTSVTLSVEHDGDVKRVSTTVIPRAAPALTGFTVAPTSVRGGQSVTITATISNPAPEGGTVVHLAEFPSLAGFDVPATLLIPQFATRKTITVAAPRLALPLSTDVKASLDIVFLNRTRFSVPVTINP